MSNYGTPYDDSFRTLLTDCKRLIVPLVNEMFGENWQETENVELYQNEVFITTGADEKRITDSNFTIGNSRRYHIAVSYTHLDVYKRQAERLVWVV